MSKIKLVLNREGVRELLKSQEMQNICKEYAEEIANRSDGDYEVTTYVGVNRCAASVITADRETMRKNLDGNALLKGIGI